MVKRGAVLAALVVLVMVGAGTHEARGGVPMVDQCFRCVCIPPSGPTIVTACLSPATFGGFGSCPACPSGTSKSVEPVPPPCSELAECGPFISRAPALSHIPLAGLGVLLVIGGIWLTRKRARAAA